MKGGMCIFPQSRGIASSRNPVPKSHAVLHALLVEDKKCPHVICY